MQGLSHDIESDQYVYVWETNKGWSGTCRKVLLALVDGSRHEAQFHFVT
jgi:hypothetical protein